MCNEKQREYDRNIDKCNKRICKTEYGGLKMEDTYIKVKQDDLDIIKNFFERLYYDNDILALTDVNCFDYSKGEVDIIDVISAIKEHDLEVKVEYKQ